MRATRNRFIVAVNREQKNEHTVDMPDGSELKLYIGRDFNENGREANPVMATIVDNNTRYGYLEKGWKVLCHHNNFVKNSPYFLEAKDGIHYYSIPDGTVFAVIDEDGSVHAVCGYIVAERIEMPKRSSIIEDPAVRYYQDRVRVVRASPEVKDESPVREKDIVMIPLMADYEVVYHWKNKEKRFIRVKGADIYGINNGGFVPVKIS